MSQKKSNEQEFKSLGSALTVAVRPMTPTTQQPVPISNAAFSARSEKIQRVVEWVEMTVQIRMDPEQRAHIVVELAEMEIPEVLINCAAYILAGGFMEVYGRLDMAQWRKAIAEVPHQIGKVTKFYRQGWTEGQSALWRELRMGTYNNELKRIIEDNES